MPATRYLLGVVGEKPGGSGFQKGVKSMTATVKTIVNV